jgi:hypothetical protein
MAIKIPIISEFNPKGINAAKAEFATLQTTGSKAMFLLQKAALPAAAAIGSIAAVIKPAIKAASDFQESTSKVNVVFGQASKSIKDFAATAATSLGQSKQSVLDAAGAFGTFGKAAGLAGEDLATFTTDFVTLSTDLASFNNTSPEEAVLAIGAALRGESEPLRRYGVLLNDAVLRQEAMTLGIYDGKGALTAQQKVLAAQAAIYKQTNDAQGDFVRTSDGLANSQRTLGAVLKNVQIELGTKLLPAIQEFSNSLVDISLWVQRNPETFTKIGKGFEYIFKLVDPATKGIRGFLDVLKSVAGLVNGAEKATGAWNQELGRSSQQQMRMADAASIFNKGLTEQEEKVGGAKKEVESFAQALKDKLGEALDDANDALTDAKSAFTDFATSVSESIKSAFSFADAQEAGAETGAGFLDGLRSQVAGVVGYAAKIQALLDKNLSQDALAQVLASGAEAGAAIADQLIAGGQTAIDETNALVDSANAAAAKVGLNAAAKWYQAGIDSATAIVNGIQGELDKLTPKMMAKMDAIAAKLKRTVNIDVVITERVNKIVTTIAGNVGGIPKMAEGGIVNKPTLALIGEAGPEAVVPLSKMNAGGGGDVNINVTGGLATSAEIGQSVVNALRAYSRSAGPLALNIA